MADRKLYPALGSMNKAKALRQLERAFKRCAKAGLVFYGMDDALIAYNGRELAAQIEEQGSHHEAHKEVESEDIDTSGSYKDSGGW